MGERRPDREAPSFEVEAVLDVGGQTVIFARILAPRDFALNEESRFGGCPIVPVLSQPRAMRPDGSPRTDLYAFVLRRREDGDKFRVGLQVPLDE